MKKKEDNLVPEVKIYYVLEMVGVVSHSLSKTKSYSLLRFWMVMHTQ